MKINTLQVLCGMDGKPLMQGENSIMLRDICIGALLNPSDPEDDKKLSGEDKVARFKLAQRFANNDSIEITPEEATLVRHLVAKGYYTSIVGQVWDLLG